MQRADQSSGTLGALLDEARLRLANSAVSDPRLEARLIVEHFTETTRTDAIVTPEKAIDRAQALAALAAVEERAAGRPVHRIFGFREFYGLKLSLSAATLEPRPDTETLVDLVLPQVRRTAETKGHCRILDLGTGTGAIALALLKEVANAEAVATDISSEALATATRNADINGCAARFTPLRSNWLEGIDGRFDLIVSNPPYISSTELETLPREVRVHDPLTALDGGPDGLAPYRRIAADAGSHLTEEGLAAVEIGYDQREAVTAIFAGRGFRVLKTARDLGDRDRAILFSHEQSA
ncbi:peptide chain release factor N(5)-glutamine methyltransferase [Chelativorans sp. YIM 93263]|uniref:peptide chain release factor N(5)-glutamine methyltransferase n=1 Tax=Chelativorans sp. YIM 93263 TaxID=2906648 RepID=UPI002378A491|nr:peptide chain release factor N(5)-glutamine methyltransferase [Chelativorans sp. YIM 93263]